MRAVLNFICFFARGYVLSKPAHMRTSPNQPKLFRAAVAILLGMAALTAGASSVTENPIADAFVTTGASGNLVNSNYGGGGVLGVSAAGQPQGEFQSVLEFDLSVIRNSFNSQFGVGGWTVQSATLQLTAAPANNQILNTPSAGMFGLSLMQNNSWTEGSGTPAAPGSSGITFNSLQPLINNAVDQSLGTYSFNGATNGANTYSLSLTSGLVADIMSGSDATLRAFAADANINYLFNSRSFGTASSRPILTITASPEPGAWALLAVGLVAIWRWPRRARNC